LPKNDVGAEPVTRKGVGRHFERLASEADGQRIVVAREDRGVVWVRPVVPQFEHCGVIESLDIVPRATQLQTLQADLRRLITWGAACVEWHLPTAENGRKGVALQLGRSQVPRS